MDVIKDIHCTLTYAISCKHINYPHNHLFQCGVHCNLWDTTSKTYVHNEIFNITSEVATVTCTCTSRVCMQKFSLKVQVSHAAHSAPKLQTVITSTTWNCTHRINPWSLRQGQSSSSTQPFFAVSVFDFWLEKEVFSSTCLVLPLPSPLTTHPFSKNAVPLWFAPLHHLFFPNWSCCRTTN